MRQSLIDEGKLSIKNYTKTELSEKLTNQQVRIYLLNSLRELPMCLFIYKIILEVYAYLLIKRTNGVKYGNIMGCNYCDFKCDK